MWKGVTGSLGPWGGGGIAGMVVGSQGVRGRRGCTGRR